MRYLSVSGLVVERGGRIVLADVSFDLSAGGLLVVTGPNGAGKSTLLRALAGLVHPRAGTIAADPAPEGGLGEAAHYLGHLDGLKAGLTVGANLGFWRKVAGTPALAVREALDAVGLGALEDLPAAYLSAGQRRRVALARLLVVRRPLWLLDEPTAALDAASEATFARLLAAHCADGGLAVAATHLPLPVPAAATLRLGAA